MPDYLTPEIRPIPFSPYFTLTATWHLDSNRSKLGDPPIPQPPKPPQPKLKAVRFTVKEVFGPWKDMSDEKQAEFLLILMKHADVDWNAACRAATKECKIGGVAKMYVLQHVLLCKDSDS